MGNRWADLSLKTRLVSDGGRATSASPSGYFYNISVSKIRADVVHYRQSVRPLLIFINRTIR
eukprot:9797109-Prorocentrum_lima.AAC.1